MDNKTIKEQIEKRSREVFTDSFTLSLSELANRYNDWDIIIPEKLQRVFRWTKYQKSRLIESLLLKIPIPAIFVSEDEKQRYEIIDWLQRMSTVFEFMWILKTKKDSDIRYPIKSWLVDSEYLDLSWLTWDKLDDEWKRRIKNTRITLNIIQKESDSNAKFDLFSRLNSWGSELSPQEVRNCIILMIDESFYDYILLLSENEDYKNVMNFSDKLIETKDNMEFVLRYFSLKFFNKDDIIKDIKTFLDNKTRELINLDTFDRDKESRIFCELFKKLNKSLWSNSFHKFKAWNFTNKINYPWFDAIAQWLAYNLWESIKDITDLKIIETVKWIWSDDFNNNTDSTSWVSSEWKVKYCEKYWKTYFSKLVS